MGDINPAEENQLPSTNTATKEKKWLVMAVHT
jgi:hypothetical protein